MSICYKFKAIEMATLNVIKGENQMGCPKGTTDAPEYLSNGTLKDPLQYNKEEDLISLELVLGGELHMILC